MISHLGEASLYLTAYLFSSRSTSKLPRITLKLRAPIELENLLPYNLEYRIYDKDTDQNWRSYLRKVGIMPFHSVELGHLILLNIHVQDTGTRRGNAATRMCESWCLSIQAKRFRYHQHRRELRFRRGEQASVERRSRAQVRLEVELRVRSFYVVSKATRSHCFHRHYPNAGGSFKVQVYSPYIVLNKTWLPFGVRPSRTRVGVPAEVAGETRPGEFSSRSVMCPSLT